MSTAATPPTTTSTDHHHHHQEGHRLKQLKQFDESKTGVKGLLDSGQVLTTIPSFFVHSPEALSELTTRPSSVDPEPAIPTINLSGVDSCKTRSTIVEQITGASREFGFFQVVNHGIPLEVLHRAIGGVKGFHELPGEEKSRFYRREIGVNGDIDLFHSKAASWRDTLQIRLAPHFQKLEIPEVCRDVVVEWEQQSKRVAELLMELLCEGLGVAPGKLKELTCLEARTMVANYYPSCPQPHLTIGNPSHTDPGVLTLLLQDHVGGLQVKCGGRWVDVKPVPGALVINIGDILQVLSNDEFKSVEHRVLANSSSEPRNSIAVFFNPSDRCSLFGPFPELISPEKPAVYGQFTIADYMKRFFSKELDGRTLKWYQISHR